MFIVGFSNKTHLISAKLFCRKFKHCAIITKNADKLILHQFVSKGNIQKIPITKHGIAQLQSHGWVFILFKQWKTAPFNKNANTCVNYAKSALEIKKISIQTPYALYKYLQKNLT